MKNQREIIVVAPDQYKDLARKLTHEISKLPECNAAFWTIKQYEENEFQLGGTRYAIFIGDSEENVLTEAYLSAIKNLKCKSGACYGFDGTKAVIYGDGKLEQLTDFVKERKKATSSIKKSDMFATTGGIIAATTIVFLPLSWAIVPSIGLPLILTRHFKSKARAKKLRAEQTKAALTIFLSKHFDEWLELNREQKSK